MQVWVRRALPHPGTQKMSIQATTLLENPPRLPTTKFLRRTSVQEMTGLSRSTLYDLMAKGAFPRPIPVGAKAVRWVDTEIHAWMAAKISAR